MAKIRFSLLKIIGTLKDTTYYMLNGKYVARKANPPKRDTIYNDPRFVTVKANCLEFGGASVLSKAICAGLGENVKIFKDSYFTSRLTGACRKIIQKGREPNGAREANLFNQTNALIGLQLNKSKIFNQIYTAQPIVSINKTRDTIVIKIVNSAPENLKTFPKSATHFKLTAGVSVVSAHKWHPKTQKYQARNKAANALGATVHSPVLVCKMNHPEITLEIKTSKKIPAKVAISVWLGIQFNKEDVDFSTPFLTGKAMECIAVL